MTNEEMQSAMQFIIEHQAHFAINLQKLEETVASLGTSVVKLEESVVKLEASVSIISEKVEKLTDSQESLHRLVGAIAVAQATTETNLTRTDERLNSLIIIVERYITEHQNGNS